DNPTPGLQPEYDDLASSAPSQELAPGLPQVQPEAQTRNSKPAKVQSSLPQEEVKDQLSQPPEEAEPSITQQDAHAQYELGTENTGQRLMQGANVPSGNRNETQHSNMAFVTVRPVDVKVTKSTEAGKKPQPTSSQLQTLTQPTESPEEEEPSSTQQQILAQTLELSEETETPSTYQEAPAQPLGPLGESELSATKTKPAQLSESSRTEEPSEIQLKAPDQPSDWETEELETSPTQLKQPAQFSEHGKERLPTPHHHKAKHPHLTHVTGKPLNLQLAITPEPTTEEGNFPVLPEAAAQPSTPVNDVEPSISQQEAPNLFSEPSQGAELLQFHREAPATSSELAQQETQAGNPHTFEEGEPSWTTQEAAAQPPELPNELIPQPPELQEKTVSPLAASTPPDPPEEVELSSTLPKTLPQLPSEPPNEGAAHPPPRSETTVPTPAQGQAQQPRGAFHPLNLEATIIPERTTDGEFSTALKNATALPLKHHKVTLPPPDWVQTQHSKLSLLTVRPLHQKLISAPGISAKVRSFPTMPEIPSQPPEPPKVVQTPASHEVKAVTPGLEPAQYPTSPTVTDQPLNPELTTAVLTVETQVSVPLQEAASPPPEQPQVMLTQPEQVQAQHPNPAEVTVQPLDVEFVVTQYSVSHSPGKASTVQEKQNATTNTDICELCTCQHETLSCAGLSPKHKLHQVPVLEPNNTFTTFNFQENNILHIGETSWTTYRWAEKLNLSENGLTALHKNSFKGLLSLHYLDLSCNKIQFIEAQTFEALPFLQVLNLRCNLVKQISFGTFRAWHGMQFLHKVILNHNPLSSVEDSYLFKLPALRYLDLGTTYTPLPVVQNIIMMTLTLKTLIIPRPMACCLCQFKSDIEVVCKTVKLHCDSECVTNPKQCLEEAPVGNAEGVFMRALEARKKNTETELVIESGKSSSEQSDVSWSDFMDEELNSNDENDVVGALNYILPYFSEVNLEDVDSLLPFIQLLFSNIQNEANPQEHRVLKGPKGIRKGLLKERQKQVVREKQSTQLLAENTADGRSLGSPSTGKPGQNEGVLGPGNLLHTEQKVPVSPTLQDPLLGRSATSALAKAPHGVRNGAEDLTNSIWVLENASMRVKSMKAFKPSLPSKKHYGFHTTASLKAHRILKANPREQLTKEDAHGRPKIVEGPLFSAPRNLPHPPSQGLRSSSGEPRVQDHPFPELYDPSKTSTGSSAVENQTSENTSKQNAFTINSPVSATDSALTLISDDHTNERHWEYTSTSTEPPPPETSVPLLSSPRDGFESQLNQQLHLLVPNKEVRRLISHVTRTLKTDCSEPRMHLACAKLITRTGLLMKLLSEQQEEAVAQAHIKETYKSSGASSNQKVQGEPRDHTQEVLGHTYKNKLIVATSVMAALTLLVFIFCLIEICSHRTASEKAKEGTSSSI
ncbi:Leucine-rich repeat-containing protein 37A2, partial [Heterocephalus glaber]